MSEVHKCSCGESHEINENIIKALSQEEVLYEFSSFMKVFSDITRVKIVAALLGGEMCVGDIAKKVSTTQSAVSHQLRFLKSMRFIKPRKDGKNVYYSLMDSHISSILHIGIEHVLEDWQID